MTDLREQYARAIRDNVRLRLGPNALRLAEDGQPVMMNLSEAEAAADVVLAVQAAGIRDAARQASGQQPDGADTVPTPEEGIEDARKAMQHVLQLFLDRVPRDELDAETMADSLADALSDGLTELYRTAAQATPAAGLSDTQPTNDQARPPRVQWRVEVLDGGDEWTPMGSATNTREAAEAKRAAADKRYPQWANGDPAQRRVVRETTTWTVEEDETR